MCNKYLLTEGDISGWKEVKLDNIKDFIRNQIDIEPDFVKIVNNNFWELGDFKDFNQNMELEGVTEEYSNDNFISKCNSNDNFISKCNSNNKTFNVTEEQSKELCDFKKFYYKCDKCGSSMYANMKFGVVELECETCGCYKEI